MPQLWLSWHYRSQDESLIAFSNRSTTRASSRASRRPAAIPPPASTGAASTATSTAPSHLPDQRVEAEAIVDEIRSRLATPAWRASRIGVVTFNIQQRA